MTELRVNAGEVRVASDEERAASFVISTSSRDSHGTILNQEAWQLDRYNRNPIVGYQHAVWGGGMCNDPNPDMVIGRSEVRVEGSGKNARLVADATFEPREVNELADKIWRKIVFGSMRATSVGFSANGGKWGEDAEAENGSTPTFYFDSQELFEWSIVNMGSNPDTVKRDADQRARRFITSAVAGLRAMGETVEVERVMRMSVREALQLLEGTPAARGFRDATQGEARKTAAEFVRESFRL